jgi:cysteine desulfurase / selenocysteine lyase
MGGGDMIKRVNLRSFVPNELPYKFEAGTPAIAEAIGFGAAVDYLKEVGMAAISAHEQEIIAYALERLEEIPGVTVYGPAAEHKGGVAAFSLNGVHAHDVAQVLDRGWGRGASRASLRPTTAREVRPSSHCPGEFLPV